jgi:hypothetical protein
MNFFNRGRRGNNRGRGKRPNMLWKEGRNKKLIFSIHFDVDSEEFNQLVQTGHLDLGGKPTLS